MNIEVRTKNFYEVGERDDHDNVITSIRTYDSAAAMMRKICYMIAFDDIMPVKFYNIVLNGELIHYCGWQPGMLMEFKNSNGDIVYSREFPEFEH